MLKWFGGNVLRSHIPDKDTGFVCEVMSCNKEAILEVGDALYFCREHVQELITELTFLLNKKKEDV